MHITCSYNISAKRRINSWFFFVLVGHSLGHRTTPVNLGIYPLQNHLRFYLQNSLSLKPVREQFRASYLVTTPKAFGKNLAQIKQQSIAKIGH